MVRVGKRQDLTPTRMIRERPETVNPSLNPSADLLDSMSGADNESRRGEMARGGL